MRSLLLIALLVGIVYADEEASFELPSNWASVRSNIDTSFSCVGRAYGYYADVGNDCQLYHICEPRIENGHTVYSHSPFFCADKTVFDQKLKTCVHSTPEFVCSETLVEHPSVVVEHAPVVVEHHAVSNTVDLIPPERSEVSIVDNIVPVTSEVVHTPPVNEHVVHPVESAEVVAPVVHSEPVVIENRILPVPNVSEPVAPVIEAVVPVVHSVKPVVPVHNVVSLHSEVPNEHLVSNVVGLVHHAPVLSMRSRQNQEQIKMEMPVKGIQQPIKSMHVAKTAIEVPLKGAVKLPVVQPAKTVIMTPLPVKQVQQQVEMVAKAPEPIKAVKQQQQVEVVAKIAEPIKAVKQQQQVEMVAKAPEPVKAVKQQQQVEVIAKAPEPVKAVKQQQQVEVIAKAPEPIKAVKQQQQVEVVAKIAEPIKAVKQQQQVEVIAKAPEPIKAVKQQQQVEVIAKAPEPIKAVKQQQQVEVVAKIVEPIKAVKHIRPIVRQQTQQVLEVPRKWQGPVKQELVHTVRAHPVHTVLYNGQPTWRHHYMQLYPHLIRNNPYHIVRRQVHRWV